MSKIDIQMMKSFLLVQIAFFFYFQYNTIYEKIRILKQVHVYVKLGRRSLPTYFV